MRDEIVQLLPGKSEERLHRHLGALRRHEKKSLGRIRLVLLAPQARTKLLDVGCGNGRLAAFLKTKHIPYVGVDNNEALIRIARERHPENEFVIADQTALPFPDESFDHVWNIAAFHHVPSTKLRLQTLREMKRVLKKNGLLILTVWNLWQKKYRRYIVKSILRNLFFGEYEINDTFIPWGKEKLVERYYHAFRPAELRRLLQKSGFHIIDEFYTKSGKKVTFSESYNICFIARS